MLKWPSCFYPSNTWRVPQGQGMYLIHLCISAGPAQSPAHNRQHKKCPLNFNESLEILYTLLTPHSNPESSPSFYPASHHMKLECVQVFPKNISIWRQVPFCDSLIDLLETFVEWCQMMLSEVMSPLGLSLVFKTRVLQFKFPQEQTLKKGSKCK